MKSESEIKDSAIKEYVQLKSNEARKDLAWILLFIVGLFVMVVWAIVILKWNGVIPSIPSVPVELKTCVTRQILA